MTSEWRPEGTLWSGPARFWAHFVSLDASRASFVSLFADLLTKFIESLDFIVSMPLCSGIATFEGPATQVGATWAEKSSPIGPEWPVSPN